MFVSINPVKFPAIFRFDTYKGKHVSLLSAIRGCLDFLKQPEGHSLGFYLNEKVYSAGFEATPLLRDRRGLAIRLCMLHACNPVRLLSTISKTQSRSEPCGIKRFVGRPFT